MKWHSTICTMITPALVFTLFGCKAGSDLDRSQAKKVIEISARFTPVQSPVIGIGEAELQQGVRQGLWAPKGEVCCWFTPKGETYFSVWVNDKYHFRLRTPHGRRVVEVTGLTDGPSNFGPPGTVKTAEFTWNWNLEDLPVEVGSVLRPAGGQGDAILKLYDDGWRLEDVRVSPPDL